MLNVTFHGITGPGSAPPPGEVHTWVSLARFHSSLEVLRARADVVVTFDDGNESDIRFAVPALLERGMTARFFIVASRLNTPGYLSPRDLRDMLAQGMAIGSHGMRHQRWSHLKHAALHEEISIARDRLEQVLGSPVSDAACPFGAYGRRTLAALRQAGFSRVYTSDGGPADADAWLQARNTMHEGDGPETVARWIRDAQRPVPLLRRVKLQVKRWR